MKQTDQQLEIVLAVTTDYDSIWVYCTNEHIYEYDMTELRQAGGKWAPLEDYDTFANTIAFRPSSVVWLTSPDLLSCPDICLDEIVGAGRKFARSMDDTVFEVLLRSWRLRKEEEGLAGIGDAEAYSILKTLQAGAVLTPKRATEILTEMKADRAELPAEVRLFILRKRDEILKIADKYQASNVRYLLCLDGDELFPRFVIDFPTPNLLVRIGVQQDIQEFLKCRVSVVTQDSVKQEDLDEAVPL